MSRKRTEHEELNELTFLTHYNQLENYALSLFEWKGLPKSVNVRFLEMTMLKYGDAVFFEDPDLGFMAMPVMRGQINFYNDPIECIAWGIGYDRYLSSKDKWVIIWNNYARTSIIGTLEMYARRLAQVQRIIDVNANAQKTPVMVAVENGQLMTMKNAVEKYNGNELFIYGDKKGFDPESIKVFKTDAPYVVDKLTDYKHDLWNEVMTWLGIGNANQDKKERLVADEVSANDEQVDGARHAMLQARKDACEKINEMFPDLNVSVDYRLKNDEVVEDGNDPTPDPTSE